MCRNHHDLLEMAIIESLPLRQFFKHIGLVRKVATMRGYRILCSS